MTKLPDNPIPVNVPYWQSRDFLNQGGNHHKDFGYFLTNDQLVQEWVWEYLPDKYKYPKQPVLVPQMLPTNTWQDNLRLQLTDADWTAVRTHCYQSAGHRCEICGAAGNPYIECHEQWVFYPKHGIQYLKKLRALCTLCHKAHHLGFAKRAGLLPEVAQHICSVNNWNALDLDKAFEQAEVWVNTLSKIKWKLDLSFLQKSGYEKLIAHGFQPNKGS